MTTNQDIFRNTVSSRGQLAGNAHVSFHFRENEQLRVLFVGNSITRHSIAEAIGWPRDCGMAASAPEKDYVHRTVAGLEAVYGPVSFCIAQIADWEREFARDGLLEQYRPAVEFSPDIVIIRVGENTGNSDEELENLNYFAHFDIMAKYFCAGSKQQVVTSLFWGREAIDRQIRRVAKCNGYCYVPIWQLGEDPACKALGEYAHPGVALHPNDYGMEQIARAILAELTRP